MLPFRCTLGCVDLTSLAFHPCGFKPQRGKTCDSNHSAGGVIGLALGPSTDLRDIRHKEKIQF